METAQELTYEIDIEEAALQAPRTLSQADDCGMRLEEIKADTKGVMQLWLERKNALTNEEREALVMVREYGDMLTAARAAKFNVKLDAYTAAKWLQYTTKEEWLSILPSFGFVVEMREKHQARIAEINAEIFEISDALEYLSNYLTGATPSVMPTPSDDLPFESAKPAENILDTFERLVKAHPQQVIDYIADHRMVSDTVDAAICEITGGRVNVEDVMQSFDEVLQDEYAGFYEALNTAYAGNEATFRQELAACVEAYA